MAFVVFEQNQPYLFDQHWTACWEASQWLFDLRVENITASANTLRDYAYTVGDFLTWCASKQLKWYAASRSDIRQYFDTFDVSDDVLNKRIGILFDFYAWALARTHVPTVPFDTRARIFRNRRSYGRRSGDWRKAHDVIPVLMKKVVQGDPHSRLKYPSIEQVWKVRDAMESDRDKLLVEVFMFVGLRISELLALKVSQFSDLSLDESNRSVSIPILGKGAKNRIVLFPRSLVHRIRSWINLQRIFISQKPEKNSVLFIGRRGTLGPRAVQKIFCAQSRLSGFKVHPHMLRHFFAVHYLKYLQDIKDPSPLDQLRQILGHASCETTAKYLYVTDKERALIAEDHGSFVAAISNGVAMQEMCHEPVSAVINVARYELQHGLARR